MKNLKPNASRGRTDFVQGHKSNLIRVGNCVPPVKRFAGKLNQQIKTEGLRRRGSDAFVANTFLTGGLLLDASFLPEQPQLVGTQLFAASAAFRRDQLPQQPLCFIELRRQIDEHLLQNCGIVRQAVEIDRH